MFVFFSNRIGCAGSLLISLVGTVLLILLVRSCSDARTVDEKPGHAHLAAPAADGGDHPRSST